MVRLDIKDSKTELSSFTWTKHKVGAFECGHHYFRMPTRKYTNIKWVFGQVLAKKKLSHDLLKCFFT